MSKTMIKVKTFLELFVRVKQETMTTVINGTE